MDKSSKIIVIMLFAILINSFHQAYELYKMKKKLKAVYHTTIETLDVAKEAAFNAEEAKQYSFSYNCDRCPY